MFEIKKFELYGSLSDFLKMIYDYFIEQGWEEIKKEGEEDLWNTELPGKTLLPLNKTDTIKDQLVQFCLTKKQMVLNIATQTYINNYLYADSANISLNLYITVYTKIYDTHTQKYNLYLINNSSNILLPISAAISVKPYTTPYNYKFFLYYKDNDTILYCNLFAWNYDKSNHGVAFFQPIIKNVHSQYINNFMQYEQQLMSSKTCLSFSTALDIFDNASLSYYSPIKPLWNGTDGQLVVSKNIGIKDTTTSTFWGEMLGILSVFGAEFLKFYNINNKKYFCFKAGFLICCEDEDTLTATLPKDAEVIDMTPKPD